jgi:hypothetical protein
MLLGILITICLEILLPVITGAAVAFSLNDGRSKSDLLAMSYVYGQIILFAIFQPVFVFAILKDFKFSKALALFMILMGIVLAALVVISILKYKKQIGTVLRSKIEKPDFWMIAALVVVGIMMVMSVVMAYYDGDDAYYVAAAAEGINSDSMYKKEPYTGYAITSPYRYLFAPFPMWLAMLSKLTGIRVSAMAHSFLPWSMILLAVSVTYIFSRYLFGDDKKKRGVFMFFITILIAFGDYSIHTPENFLLARSRQGKAALASFILPAVVALVFGIIKEYDAKKKVNPVRLIMLMLVGFAGALCSTLGGVLCVSIVLTGSLCMLLTYRKIKYPFLMAVFSMPCLIFPLLYFVYT